MQIEIEQGWFVREVE